MKKLLCAVAAFILAFIPTACSDNANAPNDDAPSDITQDTEITDMHVTITIGDVKLSATLENNSATAELKEKLKAAPITVEMSDYGGWEKVGSFGFGLPTSDVRITTQPCDFVLYQGNRLVIFYGSNTWSYTRLGRITGMTANELKSVLGSGDVTVTLSL